MAGVVPFSCNTPGRKQWNIKDKKSAKRPGNQSTEYDCPESQLVLAKQLLQEKSVLSVNDKEENARLGVFWLIKASEQGNMEATDILRNCLETGEGITKHNYLDVKTCLSTSQNEKLAKRAAREMFMSLSAGQDFITAEQLRRRMRKADIGEADPKPKLTKKTIDENGPDVEPDKVDINGAGDNDYNSDEDCDDASGYLDWNETEENSGDKLTEDHLENAAVTYSRGELPLVQRVLTLTDPSNRQIQNLNYLHRAFLHPIQTAQTGYVKILDHFTSTYRTRPLSFISSSSLFQIILILILYPIMNYENLLLVIPLFIHFMSFFLMIFSTLLMLQSKKEYSNFRVWSRLFLSYDRDGNLNTEDAEFEYCKKNLRPFIVYFVSLLTNLVTYPLISEMWVPQSEFAIVAIALTFTTLYYFHEKDSSRKIDFLMLFSFAVYVLAKYPYETDGVVRQTWRFLDLELPSLLNYGLPCFASQIVGSGVEFCINFRLFFYLLLPPIFIRMAYRENWKGTYKILIPHCVTLSWWQIAILCCQGATLYGLIRSTLALIGLIFFLPIVAAATIFLPVAALLQQFSDVTLSPRTGLTTLFASIPLLLAYCIEKKRGTPMGRYISMFQMFLAFLSALFLLFPTVNEYLIGSASETKVHIESVVTWDQYSSLCRKTVWNKKTVADIQQECVHFEGATVNWEGEVEDVRIVQITNNFLKLIDNLPETLSSKLICLYGDEYDEDCSGATDEYKMKFCKTLKKVNTRYKCHARSWDRYEFEIKLRIKSKAWNDAESVVVLEADDYLRNFTLQLQIKDHIWFTGYLNSPKTIGSEELKITVDEMGCINCEKKNLISQKKQTSRFKSENIVREIQNGIKAILNFIFYPVLVFR